jgi:hypothetical protein
MKNNIILFLILTSLEIYLSYVVIDQWSNGLGIYFSIGVIVICFFISIFLIISIVKNIRGKNELHRK